MLIYEHSNAYENPYGKQSQKSNCLLLETYLDTLETCLFDLLETYPKNTEYFVLFLCRCHRFLATAEYPKCVAI